MYWSKETIIIANMLMFWLVWWLARFAVWGHRGKSARVSEMLVIVLIAAGLSRGVNFSHIGSEIFSLVFG
jgi:hypothetical protein